MWRETKGRALCVYHDFNSIYCKFLLYYTYSTFARSLSGKYALPYLLREPQLAAQRLRGFVAIAPVNTENFAPDAYLAVRRACAPRISLI